MTSASPTAPESVLYYVHLHGEVLGPVIAHDLRKIPGFTLSAQVRSSDTGQWVPAYQAVDLERYFSDAGSAAIPIAPQAAPKMIWFGGTAGARRRNRASFVRLIGAVWLGALLVFPALAIVKDGWKPRSSDLGIVKLMCRVWAKKLSTTFLP